MNQVSPASTWIVNHNLGYFPHTTIILDDGTIVLTDVDHITNMQLLIDFPAPTTGKAVCS